MKQIINDIKEAVIQANKVATSSYDTQAEVIRVEGSTLWVHIPGGVDETPVAKTVNAKEGDIVQVRVGNGRAWLVGNASAPPTDDTTAVQASRSAKAAVQDAAAAHDAAESAQESAASAQASATTAYNAATAAQTSANNALVSAQNASEYASRALGNLSTVQSVSETLTYITQHGTMTLTTDVALDPTHVYFVVDAGGDYEVGGTYYAIVTEPDVDDIGTYYELTIDESLQNYVGTHLALTNEGLWLLPATSGTNKVLIATGAGSTYTIAGTYLIDSTGGTAASFRADGATMSANNVQIAHLGYGAGTDIGGGISDAPFFTLGTRGLGTKNPSAYSSSSTYEVGVLCKYNGEVYVCRTAITTPEAWNASHWQPLIGNYSTAEGEYVIASGGNSHAEGRYAAANGYCSHAEGGPSGSPINGPIANGDVSHAEGSGTIANGVASHAQNNATIANGTAQTALGKFNVADTTSAVIVGNGTASNARSNALTIDWNGGVDTKGDVNIASGKHYKINGTNLAASDVGAVPTTRKVNNKALSSDITLSASDVSALPITGGTVTGSLAIDNHSSAIGTVKQAYAAAKSVSNNANTNLASISLEAGTWVVTGGVRFPANATGYRRMNIGTSSGSNWADVQLPAANGASTQLSYTVIITTTSTKTYYLNCYHNAGTTLNLVAGGSENGINFIRAVRIA